MTDNVAVAVPLRRNQHRTPLWNFTKQRWATLPWPLLEIWDDGPGLFNRSWCLNRAAERAGDWEVLVVIDGDVLVPHEQVYEAVDLARQTDRMTVAFNERYALNRASTQRVLRGFPTSKWDQLELDRKCKLAGHPQAGCKMSNHNSNSHCIAIPRPFWEEVQGFDERFIGWGFEDMAVLSSHLALRGEPERIPGRATHLWHPRADERRKSHPHYGVNKILGDRYFAANKDAGEIRALLDERLPAERYRVPSERNEDIAVLVFTDGRRECIERTIPSAERQVTGQITNRIIIDDSADEDYAEFLHSKFSPRYRIVSHPRRLGFGHSIADTWKRLPELTNAGFIFHLEDDFVFDRPVDLHAMRQRLIDSPRLAQTALLRKAYYPREFEAGGIIQQHPHSYHNRGDRVEHTRYFTTNPSLYPRWVTTLGWPTADGSEQGFTKDLVERGFHFSYWGDGTPWVSHIGAERVGIGY